MAFSAQAVMTHRPRQRMESSSEGMDLQRLLESSGLQRCYRGRDHRQGPMGEPTRETKNAPDHISK